MSQGCTKAQVTAHLQLRRIRGGRNRGNNSPKTLECEKVGKVLYNCTAASHVPIFATLSFRLHPQTSRFQIHFHICFCCLTPIPTERWRRRKELPNRRKQAPRRRAPAPSGTKSGCHCERERRSLTDWWRLAYFLTVLSPDGDRPSVSPSQRLIPMKWWYSRIISGAGWDFLFIHS